MNSLFSSGMKNVGAPILTGVLVALPYNFPQLYLLTWFAFVPLLWAVNSSGLFLSYCKGLIAGLVFYLVAALWIVDFIRIYKGYEDNLVWLLATVFFIYCAQLPALLCLLYRYLDKKLLIHPYVLFPSLVVVFYGCYPMLFSTQLGESQSHFLAAIQAIAWTGVSGLDFMIGLSNILIYRTLIFLNKDKIESVAVYRSEIMARVFSLLLFCMWFGYGLYASQQWREEVAAWPTRNIGFVQPNETPSVNVPPPAAGYSRAYPPEMEVSEQMAVAQALDIIIWPETRYKGYFAAPHVQAAFKHHIETMAVPIIFQDLERVQEQGKERKYNSAGFINHEGNLDNSYQKIKRVAFGEYAPFVDYSSALKKWLKATLGDFYIDMSKGRGPTTFTTNGLTIVPLICYEVMFSRFVAVASDYDPEGKLLVALSNNGWFGETRQPYQHLNASVLRAVENRLPMVHVVNNGPSAVISPSGRILFQTEYHQGGGFVAAVPYPEEKPFSFYRCFPDTFIGGLVALLASILLYRVKRKKYGQLGTEFNNIRG